MIFNWSTAQHATFKKAKSLIASTPIVQYFDPKKQVILHVDASEKELGETLL